MTGETNLNQLLKTMRPRQNAGDYVFCVVDDLASVDGRDVEKAMEVLNGFL